MAEVDDDVAAIVAHMPHVRGAVRAEARAIAARARSLLAAHTKTGTAEIEISYGTTDAFVSLVDKAALSIEYGHFVTSRDGSTTYVEGLYIITRAAGL